MHQNMLLESFVNVLKYRGDVMAIIWALVLTVCVNGQCEEWVLNSLHTLEDCTISFAEHAYDVSVMDPENMYILACEKTIIKKVF